MKTNSLYFLATSCLVISSLVIPTSGLAQQAQYQQNDHQSGDVFSDYLSYKNHVISKTYNIQSTWFVKGTNESELAVLEKIEQHLQERLAQEAGGGTFPAINIKAVSSYDRRVVCDLEKAILVKDRRETYDNRTTEGSAESSRSSGKSSYANSASGSSGQVDAYSSQRQSPRRYSNDSGYSSSGERYANANSGAESHAEAYGETYSFNGRTIIHITDKEWEKTCVKKHYEFRGTLMAEKLLRYSNLSSELKLYLVKMGIKTTTEDFGKRAMELARLLPLTLSEPYFERQDLKRLGFKSQPALLAFLKDETTSLVSTYINVVEAAQFFSERNYQDLGNSFGAMSEDMKGKLVTVKSVMEDFSGPSLRVAYYNRGEMIENVIYSEEQLKTVFGRMGLDFAFKGTLKDGVLRGQIKKFEKSYSRNNACVRSFMSKLALSQKTAQSGQILEAKGNDLDECAEKVTIEFVDQKGILDFLKGSVCLFDDTKAFSQTKVQFYCAKIK
ncbi:MAG: hypothetical protein JNM39_05015 [Bdellovibrionaceae bacterium]|nr:hypothetical protein [Pseudobdellovibrionaceae bacterium]